MSDFLPQDYKEPVTTNYMEFEDGDNTFRVLDNAITGWEYWSNKMVDGELKARPTRVKEEESIPVADVLEGKYGLQIYYFWTFPVFNFSANRIQILVVKQKSVRRGMIGYIKNPKWGDPKQYNFVVTKIKNGDKTEYSVQVEPKEKLDQSVLNRFKSMNLDLQVWMAGDDPFAAQKDENTSLEQQAEDTLAKDVADSIPF